MRVITLLLMMMFITSMGFAQRNPIDFETGGYGAAWTWTVFENATNPAVEIIANPDPSGINTSATVAKFTALQAGNPYAGVESAHGAADLGPFVLGATNSTIKIMVWKPVISDVGVKLISANGWAQVEIKKPNTVVNAWEELTFDFSAYVNPPEAEGQLDQIVIFPDWGSAARAQDNIVYFDNITFNQAASTPDVPATAAPTPPAREAADVISIFSNAYTNVENTDFNPSWSQSTVVANIDIAGNATLRYGNFNFQGTQFASPLNVTGMETLHLDMWTSNATTVNIFCISTGPVERAYALPVTANQWVSYNIPLTEFSGVDLADIIQIKFTGGTGTETIYLDNIYFYKAGPLADQPKSPIDFETGGYGAAWTWSVFENSTNPALEIIANPDPTGSNTSATVAKFTALQAGNPWAGVESAHGAADLGPFVLDANNSIIKIMVWKPVISDVGIKLVAPTSWAQPEIKVANTVVNAWEELTFDFSAYVNPPEAEGKLDQIVVFPDYNLAGRGQDNIVYFDNITFNPASIAPTAPTTAAPAPPAREAADVISIFSNAYTQVENTDFNPFWNQSTVVSTIDIAGNATLRYANFNYQGTQFASPLNATGMETLHIDMWTANATAVNISCINPGPVEKAYALPVTANQWVSYNIPLSEFTGLNLADIIQIKFDGGTGTQTIFLDNIYFYKAGATSVNPEQYNAVKLYPNPVKSGELVQLGAVVKHVDVLDFSGRIVSTLSNTSVIQTDGLNRGVYILRIHTKEAGMHIQKLLVN